MLGKGAGGFNHRSRWDTGGELAQSPFLSEDLLKVAHLQRGRARCSVSSADLHSGAFPVT